MAKRNLAYVKLETMLASNFPPDELVYGVARIVGRGSMCLSLVSI